MPRMTDTPGLDEAYAPKTPEQNRTLYADWAATYEDGFAGPQDYRLPALVADAFHRAGGEGPVLDVGAGTGLVGARLAELGVAPADGIDISAEMLALAREKRLYSGLFLADVTAPLDLPDDLYAGVVSAGTFTLGHVGPEPIAELLRVARPGALFVLSVNRAHFTAAAFDKFLAGLGGRISAPDLPEVAIYGPAADPAHRHDRAVLATFRKL